MKDTIKEIYILDRQGSHDKAMKMLYSDLYDILSTSNYKECNMYLRFFLLKPFSLELQVAFARITKPFKENLPNRVKLISSLKENLFKECSYEEAKSVIYHVE
jgi:hypothetical protein